MVSCHICGAEFSRQDALSRHLKRKYPCHRGNAQNENIGCDKHDSPSVYKLHHMKRSDGISTKALPIFDGTDFDTERSQQDEEGRKTPNDFQHIGHGYPDGNQYNNATNSDDKDDETESEENESDEEMFEPLPKYDIATYTWHDDGSMRKKHSSLLPSSVRLIIIGKF